MVEVNHLQGHILSHFIDLPDRELPHPGFPFLCLLVSGGHTQIVRVDSPLDMEIIGTTIDDAAGEAFDKCAKVMGLPYPGGPVIDRLAKEGDPQGVPLRTPPRRRLRLFVLGPQNLVPLHAARRRGRRPRFHRDATRPTSAPRCQSTIVEILLDKLVRASKEHGHPRHRHRRAASRPTRACATASPKQGRRRGWRTFLPEFKFTTDNAAMIAMAGYYRYQHGDFSSLDVSPVARLEEL